METAIATVVHEAQRDEGPAPHIQPEVDRGGKGSGSGGPPDLHPFIQGLLQELPPAGEVWSEPERQLWLATAASIFRMIYKGGRGPDETLNASLIARGRLVT
jgi:hypothetical protein